MNFFRFRPKDDYRAYYPNNVGTQRPAGRYYYEFLMIGKDVPNAPIMVINELLLHHARLLTIKSDIDEVRKEFTLAVLCNLNDCELEPKDLALLIRDKGFITSLEFFEMRGRMFGRSFPLTFHDKHRAVALHSSTLINLATRLAEEFGVDGPSFLYEEGRTYVREVIHDLKELLKKEQSEETGLYDSCDVGVPLDLEAYCLKCKTMREIQEPKQVIFRNKKSATQGICPVCEAKLCKIGSRAFNAMKTGSLIENTQGFLLSAGWGTFQLRTEIKGRQGSVTILDPPTLDGDISYGNQFLEGLAAGFLEAINGANNEMKLISENYDRQSRILSLRFAERMPVRTKQARSKIKVSRENKKITRREEAKDNPTPSSSPESIEVYKIVQSLKKIERDPREPMQQGIALKQELPQEIVVQEN